MRAARPFATPLTSYHPRRDRFPLGGGTSALIVVADGDPDAREIFGHMVAALGHRVVVATCAGEAWGMAVAQRADVALVEMVLPSHGGLSLVRALRDLPTRPTRVIAMTAACYPAAGADAISAGADVYLEKPIGYAQLQAALATVLRTSPGSQAR